MEKYARGKVVIKNIDKEGNNPLRMIQPEDSRGIRLPIANKIEYKNGQVVFFQIAIVSISNFELNLAVKIKEEFKDNEKYEIVDFKQLDRIKYALPIRVQDNDELPNLDITDILDELPSPDKGTNHITGHFKDPDGKTKTVVKLDNNIPGFVWRLVSNKIGDYVWVLFPNFGDNSWNGKEIVYKNKPCQGRSFAVDINNFEHKIILGSDYTIPSKKRNPPGEC